MTSPSDPPVIKAMTNEWVLLIFRSFMSVTLAVCAWFLTDMKSSQERLAAQFNDFRLTNEARISKVEGDVGLLRGSIDVHRGRLQGLDAETRSLWGRMFDMSKAKGNP